MVVITDYVRSFVSVVDLRSFLISVLARGPSQVQKSLIYDLDCFRFELIAGMYNSIAGFRFYMLIL